jgi:hypothetical protein
MIAVVVSSKLATLTELDTTLGTEDLHDLLEIVAVDSHNRNVMSEPD